MQELKGIAEAGSAAGVPAPVAARRKSLERLAYQEPSCEAPLERESGLVSSPR